MKKNILICLLFYCSYLGAQLSPIPPLPQPATMNRDYSVGPKEKSPAPVSPKSMFQGFMQAFKQQPEQPENINTRNQAIIQSVIEEAAHFEEIERKQITLQHLIYKGFPSWADTPGTDCFFNAFNELNAMLCDSIPLSLERAVFLVENAFMENSRNFSDFQKAVTERIEYCRWRMAELKLNPKDGLAKNMVIFSLLTDTLHIKQPGTEKTITHYPLTYNLDDYDSQKDYTSHFVSTLLNTNVGQCHSIPLLYLIMAERLGAEAYLAHAPMHSLIRIKDDKGAWYNLELTSRAVLSDYHYMNNSYIKSEAIRNKLYLNPLTPKQTIAYTMTILGRYYLVKYGYDPFLLDCVHQTQKYLPNSIDAKIIESDYQTQLTLEIAHLLDVHNPEALRQASPDAYKHYERMHQLYKELDDSGYEPMPKEIYQRWLKHVEQLKRNEQQHPQPSIRKTIH